MQKSVCMLVWNHFTNDARVLRECTALAESGYDVDLIAIHDPNDKTNKRFESRDGFNIIRVKRYPSYLTFSKKIIGAIKKYPITLLPIILLYGLILIKLPVLSVLATIYVVLITVKQTRGLLIKAHIILNMIYYGLKKKYDIYHSNDLNTLPQGYICSKILRRKKLVYDSHEVQTSRTGYGKNIYYIEKFFVKRVDKMIMTTKTRADYVEDLYKNIKPEIIHNYPFYTGDDSIENKYDLHEMLDIPKDKRILLYQGGVQQGRGLERIIEATPYFNDGIVVFIGAGKLKPKIIEMVKEMNLEEKVKFLDKVPVDELKYYTAAAYLGFQVLNNVCFNHYSALSNKLFEYIMSEVPVVACDFPEIKRIVNGEEIGISIDSHNPRQIGDAVNALLENGKYYKMAKENCKAAKLKYNWNNEKENFVKIYDDLLNKDVHYNINQNVEVTM